LRTECVTERRLVTAVDQPRGWTLLRRRRGCQGPQPGDRDVLSAPARERELTDIREQARDV